MSELRQADIERIFREEHGRAVATLVRRFRSVDLAEECVQDAFLTAVQRWPSAGLPPSPAGWIITTARNRAIDRLRRESSREDRHAVAVLMQAEEDSEEASVQDERLQLMFMCCHPALALSSQVALTLRLLGGLAVPQIARAFLVTEVTMAQRLVRAKAKIRDAGIPYRIPAEEELPERVRAVLAVIYLIFNEGYVTTDDDRLIREELCEEAIRLARLMCEQMPDHPEVLGLLALLLLIDSRRAARVNASRELVLLADQDRSLWNRERMEEGRELVRRCLRINQPGPYQIQAAINAVHSDAASAEQVDWPQILKLYDHLLTLDPTPIVALNRAVVVAEVKGPEIALRLVDELSLRDYYLFHAIRADLLRRLDRREAAAHAYDAAIERCSNPNERKFLQRRRAGVSDRS